MGVNLKCGALVKVCERNGRSFHRVREENLSPFLESLAQFDRPIEIRFGVPGPIEQAAALGPVTAPPAIAGPIKHAQASNRGGLQPPHTKLVMDGMQAGRANIT